MIPDISPLAQATLGTLFTWGLTAAGAGVVIIISGSQRKLLDSSLGFAAGVMLAASYWSLLGPAIEMAEQSKNYGLNGEYAFLPVSVGFLFGGLFVYLTDLLISSFGLCAPHLLLAMQKDVKKQMKKSNKNQRERSFTQTGLTLEDINDSNFSRRKTLGPDNHQITDSDFSDSMSQPLSRPYTMFSSSDPTSLNYHHANNFTVPFSTSSLGNPRSRTLLKSYPKFNVNHKRPATVSNPQNVYEIENTNCVREDNFRRNSDSLGSATKEENTADQWKRIVLLIVAITVHNIPEGLAVGVGFGAIGSASSATFESARMGSLECRGGKSSPRWPTQYSATAKISGPRLRMLLMKCIRKPLVIITAVFRNLAIGIGIQNFPEGLAVSLPLKAVGFSLWKSFWYGQLSGMVEPIFGILGAAAVSLAKPLLPYALSFAAGAMIYVVVDDIIPEANASGSGKLATSATIIGFVVMMALDVGLGG